MRLAAALLLIACTGVRQRITLSPTPSQLAKPGPVLGVARVDVTPPPGGLLGGHGPDALLAQGHRGRLECAAAYFADARGEALAWVSCDFAFVSTLLQRQAAARLRELAYGTRCEGLGSDRLAISATHTHGGPAHLQDALAYTSPVPGADGYSPPHPGFDPALVAWLADRIATAVVAACRDADRPGRASIRWSRGTVTADITVNQSPLASNEAPSRDLDVLELRRDARTVGVFFFFGIHPTAVPNGNDVYEADLVEAARLRIHHGLRDAPIVLFINGGEGDVGSRSDLAPGFNRAREVGRALGDAVLATLRTPGEDEQLTLEVVARDFALAGGQPIDAGSAEVALPCSTPAWRPPAPSPDALCALGTTGAAAGGGSEDGPSIYRGFPFYLHEGLTSERSGCQRPKQPLFFGLADEAGACMYPEVASLMRLRIGARSVLTVPFEPTVAAARHLAPLVASLTNGYLGYVTTADEYRHQHYEGASTLYGERELEFLVQRVVKLTASSQRAWDVEVELRPPHVEAGGRPDHAIPVAADGCPAFELESAGQNVRATWADGETIVDSLGAPVTDAQQSIEVRTDRVLWHPDPCPPEGTRACLERDGHAVCARLRVSGWSVEPATGPTRPAAALR